MEELIKKIMEKVKVEFESAVNEAEKKGYEKGKSEGGGGEEIDLDKVMAIIDQENSEDQQDLKEKIKKALEKEIVVPEPEEGEEPSEEEPKEEEPVEGEPNPSPEVPDGGQLLPPAEGEQDPAGSEPSSSTSQTAKKK